MLNCSVSIRQISTQNMFLQNIVNIKWCERHLDGGGSNSKLLINMVSSKRKKSEEIAYEIRARICICDRNFSTSFPCFLVKLHTKFSFMSIFKVILTPFFHFGIVSWQKTSAVLAMFISYPFKHEFTISIYFY